MTGIERTAETVKHPAGLNRIKCINLSTGLDHFVQV